MMTPAAVLLMCNVTLVSNVLAGELNIHVSQLNPHTGNMSVHVSELNTHVVHMQVN